MTARPRSPAREVAGSAPGRFRPQVSTSEWGGRVTRAEVNLDAIAENAAEVRKHVAPAKLLAVVKADAYGHGAPAVARAALDGGASWLAVYAVPEGVRLRQSGITAPILVFGPFQRAEATHVVRYGLTPTVHNNKAGVALQEEAGTSRIPFHIKLDTGLSRSGVDPSDALPLLRALSALPALDPQGIYTHFARADEPDRPETSDQLNRFLDAVAMLEDKGFRFDIKHSANTAALLSRPDSRLDMVRLGIGLYGYNPVSKGTGPAALTPALTLLSSLVRVHTIPPGTGVGYGHEFLCRRDTRLGLVPIGYGDGLPRTLANGAGQVLVRGTLAPIVGRVSMDQITIDLTDVHDAAVGDDVVLVGASGALEHDADDLGDEAGTISYHILTGLLPRVPRLYVRRGRLLPTGDELL